MQQIADFHIHSKYSRACSRDLTLENIDKACRIKGVDIIGTGDFTFPEWFKSIQNEFEELQITSPSPLLQKERKINSPSLPKRELREVKKISQLNIPPTPLQRGTLKNPPHPPFKRGNSGLYKLKKANNDKVKFILTTEVALIYKKNDRCRRIHIMIHAPNISAVEELNKYLDKHYNIRSDGRPILGMSCEKLIELCLKIHPKFLIYPAHIWTPWFSMFGSKSGFDSVEECFGEFTPHIYAYETGLSSDPEMNWRVSQLDNLTLLSNSDAHSLPNIAREANVFDLKEISYDSLYNVIKLSHKSPLIRRGLRGGLSQVIDISKKPPPTSPSEGENYKLNSFINRAQPNMKGRLLYTVEFYPEEGMYHYDGHRDCGVCLSPEQTKKEKGICPKCKKPLVIGVDYRVNELADHPKGRKPKGTADYKKLVELDKIIAEALGVKSRSSKKVQQEYNEMIKNFGSELDILINIPLDRIKEKSLPIITEGIKRMREGNLIIKPGFDGQYGEVKIFNKAELTPKQQELF